MITPVVTGTLGTNGWYRSNVQVSWTVADPQSAIGGSTGCGPTTLTSDTTGVTLTCTATNAAGLSATASVTVKVDKTVPAFAGMPTSCSIWPVNQKMVDVGTISASDAQSGLVAGSFGVTGSSNDGATASDIGINPAGASFAVELRAERNGKGDGRVYTLVATATDRAGNTGTATSTCVVPHDKGK